MAASDYEYKRPWLFVHDYGIISVIRRVSPASDIAQ